FSEKKIRLAYCSADFNRHATAHLMAELFERHDREHFQVIAVDYSDEDGSPMRARLKKAFDHVLPVQGLSNRDAARAMADQGVDIAVELKGHTAQGRMGILAHRPAPVQISWLGYPGATGADFLDHVIGDAVTLPLSQQPFYSERILHLPGCYQPNSA